MMTFIGILWDIVLMLPNGYKILRDWIDYKRPAAKVLGNLTKDNIEANIFVKDFFVKDNTFSNPKLFSEEGPTIQAHPNVEKVWPEAEGRGIAELLNLFGNLGKRSKLEVVEMSKGFDVWNKNMIILGAQAMKCMDFYEIMDNVGYKVDEKHIYDNGSNEIIAREDGYGYGLIIKAKNPQMKNGIGILLGGFGVLGTEAAIHFFIKNIAKLGKEYKSRYFSIVVRAKISAGKQSVKRIKKYDKVFN